MKKYYLMAIELSNSNAMDNLGTYYEILKKYGINEVMNKLEKLHIKIKLD